jgi:hypothetical protein
MAVQQPEPPALKEENMERRAILYSVRVGIVTGIFATGFLCGSLTQQHNADAQMGELGGQLMEKAAGGGGILGTAAKLGTSITEMEKHVTGLQKNIDILKKIKASMGG